MKINGEQIGADFLDFRAFVDGTARLALDHGKGALCIVYQYDGLTLDERCNMSCCPEALEYGGDGKGKALFKQGWRYDPATGTRSWEKPFIPCHVETVPYDDAEQKLYEKREAGRASAARMIEEERQRTDARTEEARLDRAYKVAFIESRKPRNVFRGVEIVEEKKKLLLNGVTCVFDGPKRWAIVKLLTETTDPDGWVVIPGGSKALACFKVNKDNRTNKGKTDAERFRDMIEPESAGSGNKGKRFRIRSFG